MTVTTDESVRAPTEVAVPDVWTRLMACSPYTGRPAAIRDVVTYTRAGGWIPGDHDWWVELPGYAYGWLIAIPVTIALYAVSWVLQRPSRLAMVALVAGLLWWAGG